MAREGNGRGLAGVVTTRPWYAVRIEPARPAGDPERGLHAELADPAWMIGRQWQLGELRGENASSPIQMVMNVTDVAIEPNIERPADDPATTPAEAIVEGGPDDWWTTGRRLRLGRAADSAGLIADLGVADMTLRCQHLPPPYDICNKIAYDGLAVYRHRPDHAVFSEVPMPGPDFWDRDEFVHRASFPAGTAILAVGGAASPGTAGDAWIGHDGGAVDWWSVDATGRLDVERDTHRAPMRRWPNRFDWPGGPARRWWQIEDHAVDLGGRPPDRAHLATAMLLDLVMGHADDWFLTPVDALAGTVLVVHDIRVIDAFGDSWSIPTAAHPADGDGTEDVGGWTLFAVSGLERFQLPMWLTAPTPLTGDPIEEVAVGVDEDANLVWTVEERLQGRVTNSTRPAPLPAAVVDDDTPLEEPPVYRYQPVTTVPAHWTPYTREVTEDTAAGSVRYRQARLVTIDADGSPGRADLPTAELLQPESGRVHEIAPWRLPPTGLRLERRPMLTRSVDGSPRLWVQRRRVPLLGPPASGLAFDITDAK